MRAPWGPRTCAAGWRSYPGAAVGATFIALAAARLASQSPFDVAQGKPPGPVDSLTTDLAARIAAAITPGTQVSLEAPTDDVALGTTMADRLAALGVRVVGPAAGVPSVRVSCLDNLREQVCSAEIAAATRTAVFVTRPRKASPPEAWLAVALELRPVLSQRARILDVARTDDGILVLSPTAIVQYEQMNGSWRSVESQPVMTARPWPRDVRGRLRVARGRVEAFLPGVTCAGNTDPLALVCADGVAPWPLDIENVSLDRARNYFRTPDGLAFYGIAGLSGDAGARWLAATIDHTLTFVDENRQSIATTISGDDVVSLRAPCAAHSYVVAASPSRDRDADLLTLFQAVRRRLVPAASPVMLPGELTALWSTSSADAATVITYDRNADRYDAHELTVSCSR